MANQPRGRARIEGGIRRVLKDAERLQKREHEHLERAKRARSCLLAMVVAVS